MYRSTVPISAAAGLPAAKFTPAIATMSAMEVDGAAAPVELPCLSLDVLAIVKDAQGLHGLKHSDYQRYRWVPEGGWAGLECSRR